MNSNENLTPQDVSNILLEGVGAPYVAVFDAASNAIIDPSSGLPIGELIDNFVYEYAEEKEDSGSFVITTKGSAICDVPALQYSNILWIQWGYLLPNGSVICGKARQVMITDISAGFKNDRVTLEIKFADSSIRLKNVPANYFSTELDFFNDLVGLLQGYSITPVIKRYRSYDGVGIYLLEKLEASDYNTEATNTSTSPEVTVITPTGYANPLTIGKADPWGRPVRDNKNWKNLQHQATIQPASEIPEGAVPVKITILDSKQAYSDEIQSLIDEYPDRYRLINPQAVNTDAKGRAIESSPLLGELYRSVVVTRSAPNNIWGQLHSLASQLPGGPFYMDGRDGSLVIHNMASDRPVSLVYTYQGGSGELLDFEVTSKFIRSAVEVSTSSDIEPDSKHLVSSVTQGSMDRSMTNPDLYYSGWDSNLEATTSLENSPAGRDMSKPYEPIFSSGYINNGTGTLHDNGYRIGSYAVLPKTYADEPTRVIAPGEFTKEERENYLRDLFNSWNSAMNGQISTQLDLENFIRQGFYIKPLKVTRIKVVDIVGYSPDVELRYKGGPGGGKNLISRGKNRSYYYDNTPEARFRKIIGDNEIIECRLLGDRYSNNSDGINYETFPHYSHFFCLGDKYHENDNSAGIYRIIYKVEESIDGIRVLSDTNDFTSIIQANDVKESINNQVKASATVLGRPSIESSMNIQINNVAKFSGTWYTKKVIHRINTSTGYTTEIDFVQRTSTITETVISKRQALSEVSQQLNQEVARSIKTGTWEHSQPEYLEKVFETIGYPNSSLMVSPNPGGYSVIESDKDTVFNTAEGIDHQNQVVKNQ